MDASGMDECIRLVGPMRMGRSDKSELKCAVSPFKLNILLVSRKREDAISGRSPAFFTVDIGESSSSD